MLPVSVQAPVSKLPSISGAAVLLSLGGLCLVVAAIVFLSVSWNTLTLGAKVAALAGVTGLLAAAATAVTRRGLRGSAETLITITLIDAALDLWATRRAHLGGLQHVPVDNFGAGSAAIIALLAVGSCLAVRHSRLARVPIGGQLVFGVAGTVAVLSALAASPLTDWVAITVAVFGLAGLGFAARVAGLRLAGWTFASAAGLAWSSLTVTGLAEIVTGSFVPQLWHGTACELPAATALALLAALGAPRGARRSRTVAAIAGFGLVWLMAVEVLAEPLPLPVALAGAVAAAGLVSRLSRSIWNQAGAVVLVGAIAVNLAWLAVAAIAGVASAVAPIDGLWQRPATARLLGWQPAAVWAGLLLLAATALVVASCLDLVTSLRPGTGATAPTQNRAVTGPVLAGLTSAIAAALAMTAHPSLIAGTGLWLAAAGLGLLAARRAEPALLAAPGFALVLAELTGLRSDLAGLLAFSGGAVLVVAAGRLPVPVDAEPPVSAGPDWRAAVEVAAIAQFGVAAAALCHRFAPADGSPAVAGLLAAAGAFAIGATLSRPRRWWLWPALAAVTAASWIEAASRHLHAPEFYSVPIGLLVLAFGVRATRQRPKVSSWWDLGPGLLILTVPSLVVALDDPLSWRVIATALVALAAVLFGSRLRLQAPLLIGAGELALLVLRELGPYAYALPRWAVIGAVGVLLLGVGVTWENRVGNLRRLRRELTGMR